MNNSSAPGSKHRTSPDRLSLVAFKGPASEEMPIVPASRTRTWIDDDARHGRHCLPLMMANQAGWWILNHHGFTARWQGGSSRESLEIAYDGTVPRYHAHSAFGYGILTFMIPYLFRTPPGMNLLARGPANWPRDGIAALEGLVETDWAVSTLPMSWKFTRPGVDVRFDPGEPICMVIPQPRGLLERFEPELRQLESDPEVRQGNAKFNQRRHDALVRSFVAEHLPQVGRPLDKDYLRGSTPTGRPAPDHQRKLNLKPFREIAAAPAATEQAGT